MKSNEQIRAVCGVVARDHEGRVLLIQRRDDRTWGLPGGGVEVGESWQEAAERECSEETGWRVRIDGILGIYSDPATQLHDYPSGLRRQFFGVVFTARALEQAGSGEGEAHEMGFFRLEELPGPLFGPDVPALLDAAAGASRPYLR